MSTRTHSKLIREGEYFAEVEVRLLDDDVPRGPHLSLEDALRLDRVREALRRSDISTASKLARVYCLMPLNAA